jgi:hypothetical protein
VIQRRESGPFFGGAGWFPKEKDMKRIDIDSNHVTFDNVRYFTRAADKVRIGSLGEKLTPIFGVNGLDPKDLLAIPRLQRVKAAAVAIGQDGVSKNAFDGSVMALVSGVPTSLSGSVATERARQDQLRLMHVYVLIRDLIDALNASSDALGELRRYGNDARVVSDCLFLIEGQETTSFQTDVDVRAEAGAAPLDVTLHNDHAQSGTVTVKYDHRVNYAYLLQKIEWNDAKTKVVDLKSDTQGL